MAVLEPRPKVPNLLKIMQCTKNEAKDAEPCIRIVGFLQALTKRLKKQVELRKSGRWHSPHLSKDMLRGVERHMEVSASSWG